MMDEKSVPKEEEEKKQKPISQEFKKKKEAVGKAEKKKKLSTGKLIGFVILAAFLLFIIIQFINASYYKMLVNVVEEENVIGVNPTQEKLDFGDLSRNNAMTRYITLKSEGRTSTYVIVWKFGSISSLIKLNKNFFTLSPDQEIKLAFDIHIPPSAETQKYKGRVIIFKLPKFF